MAGRGAGPAVPGAQLPMSQPSAADPKPDAAAGHAGLLARCGGAVAAAERLLHHARAAVRARIDAAGGLDAEQAAGHGLAWLATYVEALRQKIGRASCRERV